jgi:response regulator of citrate/malate metabolism
MSDQAKKEILDDIDKFKSIEVLNHTDGGKILVNTIFKDVVNTVDTLAVIYKTATLPELQAHCASLQSNLALLKVFKNAKKQVELAEEALKSLAE